MKLLRLPSLGVLFGALLMASINATPADARTTCEGSASNAKCHAVRAKKKFAKRTRAQKTDARPRRIARIRGPWHGWGASFHLDGVRYPGGNPSGPAFSYNNYEGGFRPQRSGFFPIAAGTNCSMIACPRRPIEDRAMPLLPYSAAISR